MVVALGGSNPRSLGQETDTLTTRPPRACTARGALVYHYITDTLCAILLFSIAVLKIELQMEANCNEQNEK